MRINDITVFGKVLSIISIFGIFCIASSIYSANELRHIDDDYSALIEHQDYSSTLLARASQNLTHASLAITELLISTTDAGNRDAVLDLTTSRRDFLENIAKAKAGMPDLTSEIDAIQARTLALLDQSCTKTIKMGREAINQEVVLASQHEFLASCQPHFAPILKAMTAIVDRAIAASAKSSDGLTATTNRTVIVSYLSVFGGLTLVVTFAYLAISKWISRPLRRLAASMRTLAGGDLTVAIEGAERKDEIGPMAQAVQVFRDNGLRLHAREAEAAHQQTAEQVRAANEATREAVKRQQEAVVAALAAGLDRLSKGDLTSRLNQVFPAEYETLRADFNATADSLHEAMSTIVTATDGISTGSDQIAHASDDLSRRTEQQAASLEETAAALNVITATVKTMAADANEAAKVVVTTRTAAESSGAIVERAVEAMGKIKASSSQITNIIGVIDEIAFQTNLLALNAGVEAARAGDGGRGFAVVASEVRGLAQRSAEAAKEIKALISASSDQVETGVVLVDQTGSALRDIVAKVAEMDALVRQISASSKEQATGLAEINTAVGQMDHVVQQNAAMVEESTAAAHALKSETQDLMQMVGRFQLGSDAIGSAPRPVRLPDHRAEAFSAIRRRVG